MRKYTVVLFIVLIFTVLLVILPRLLQTKLKVPKLSKAASLSIDDTVELLRQRNDEEALVKFNKILAVDPDNIDALWAKAETLRRKHKYQDSEALLNKVLSKNPQHLPSLNSLAYIKYKEDDTAAALGLVNKILASKDCDRQNRALAYMMLGTINSKISSLSGIILKLSYATKIKGNLLKARDLAPELPEVRLALGTFYLLAPRIIGGNINRALEELNAAIDLAPNFATANARLAQAYKAKKNTEKYNFYLARAKILDPRNEIVAELEEK